MRTKLVASAGLITAALVIGGCGTAATTSNNAGGGNGSGANTSHSSNSSGAIELKTIDGNKVLTTSSGMTLYWFAPDTSTTSKCSASCVKFWPPLKGPATAGSGITGSLGTITRSDGSKQATYMGHPLYTYVGDTAPGQVKGNDLVLSGGKWYAMTVGGQMATFKKKSGSGNSGGYGY
jgi:predicted lipoprotein with Yx(FWY)xxD motif